MTPGKRLFDIVVALIVAVLLLPWLKKRLNST